MIAVVDDDASLAKLLQHCLAQAGFSDVRCFSTAAAANHAWDFQLPDVVFLDYQLPDADGLSVLRDLRAQPGALSVVVIALTADEHVPTHCALLNAGADDVIRKPFNAEELTARLRACTRRAGRERQPRKDEAATPSPAASPGLPTEHIAAALADTDLLLNRVQQSARLEQVQLVRDARYSLEQIARTVGLPQMPRHEFAYAGATSNADTRPDVARTPATVAEDGLVRACATAGVLDAAALLERCLNKADLAEKLLCQFATELPEYRKAIRAAVAAADGELLKQKTHKLKGAAANLCLPALGDAARSLEGFADDLDGEAGATVDRLDNQIGQLLALANETLSLEHELERLR